MKPPRLSRRRALNPLEMPAAKPLQVLIPRTKEGRPAWKTRTQVKSNLPHRPALQASQATWRVTCRTHKNGHVWQATKPPEGNRLAVGSVELTRPIYAVAGVEM